MPPSFGPANSRGASLADFASVLDELPLVTWLAHEDGAIGYLSPYWARFTGLSAPSVLSRGYADFVHADDLPRVEETWDAARAAGTPYRARLRLRFGDGTYRWVQSEGHPLRSADGTPLGWLGTLVDVHDARVAEECLAQQNRMLREASALQRLVTASIPGAVWTATPDGRLDEIVDGPASPRHEAPLQRLGDKWLEGVHPEDRETVLDRWRRSLETGETYEATMRAKMLDGTYRWLLARAQPQCSDDGKILRWVGVTIDVDGHVRADADRERFVRLADASGDIIGFADPDGTIDYVNPAALALLEASKEELVGRHLFACFAPDDVAILASVILPALHREGRWAGEFRIRTLRSGRVIPVTSEAFAIRDASGAITGLGTISRDLRDRKRVEIGMRALADAGNAMHGSLDLDATMQNIAGAVVSSFATACSFEVAEPSGDVRTITLATRDPRHTPLARAAAERRNPSITPEHPIRLAIDAGRSTLKTFLEPAFLAGTGLDRYIGPEPGRLDLRSVIYVPVISRRDGRIYGSLSCGLGGDDPRDAYTEDDVRFAEEIGICAGLAFDNARDYERTRKIAVEMQAASLPASLPSTEHLRLDAYYRPAADEAAIGGDWYDAFVLGDGRVVTTIGDVGGHGLQAAILMTKLRQAMQSAAILDPDPRVMLNVANRTLRMLDRDVFATAMAAIYDPSARRFALASAGHPGPVVARRDGSVEECYFPGVMLGIVDDPVYVCYSFDLQAEDLAVFYTDGLVEADHDFEAGPKRLREALGSGSIRDAARPALEIFEGVLAGSKVHDDVAILTARAGPFADGASS